MEVDLKEVWEIYKKDLDSRDDKDYEMNQTQMKKLFRARSFFVRYAVENGGRVEEMDMSPKQKNCGVTGYFTFFSPFGEQLDEFKEIMQDISAISIDSLKNGDVCVSVIIPDVFVKR